MLINTLLINILNGAALILYFAATGLLLQNLFLRQVITANRKWVILGLAITAVVIHGILLQQNLWQTSGLNLSFSNAAALVSFAVTIIFILATIRTSLENIGIIILPIAAITILMQWFWPGQHLLSQTTPLYQGLHIIISLLAYSLLCLASAQALMLLLQDHQLHTRQPGRFLNVLPPVETMEYLMAQMIGVGFLLLTMTVITGVFFSKAIFGQPLKFNHHILLSSLGWLVFGSYLVARWRHGLRGRKAAIWVLSGIALLALGFLGTKFIMEIVLGR